MRSKSYSGGTRENDTNEAAPVFAISDPYVPRQRWSGLASVEELRVQLHGQSDKSH